MATGEQAHEAYALRLCLSLAFLLEALPVRCICPDASLKLSPLHSQAVRSGDPSQLQQAQLNIAQRRAGIRTPVGATPAGFGTPGASLLRTPGLGMTPMAGTPSMTPRLTVNAGKWHDLCINPKQVASIFSQQHVMAVSQYAFVFCPVVAARSSSHSKAL